jgi:hypothetical protein
MPAKCPVFMGLLRTAYAKLFLYDPVDPSAKESVRSEAGQSWIHSVALFL